MSIAIVKEKEKTEFWAIVPVYGLVSAFYIANFYSFGFFLSFWNLFFVVMAYGPLLGLVKVVADGFLLQWTGRWFGGTASSSVIRAAVVRSKAPSLLLLAMWSVLMVFDSKTAFIHVASNTSALFIVFLTLTINILSFSLLVKSVRKIQSFGFWRALLNVSSSGFLFFLFYTSVLFIGRYIYISLF